MQISTNTTSISLAASSTDTADITFLQDAGAIRVTSTVAHALTDITKLVVEIPSRGGLSRRLSLDDGEMNMLPIICGLGAESSDTASVASSWVVSGTTAAAQTVGYSYFDLPISVKANEDVRITIGTGGAAATSTFQFSALTSRPSRNVIFTVNDLGTGTRVDHTFRSDVTPVAVLVGTVLTGGTAYSPALLAAAPDISEINFDGNPNYTYDDITALLPEADHVITGTNNSTGRDFMVYEYLFLFAYGKKMNVERTTSTANTHVVTIYNDTPKSAVSN